MSEQETVTLAPQSESATETQTSWFQAEPVEESQETGETQEQPTEVSEESTEESQETGETQEQPTDEQDSEDQEKKTGFEKRIERFNKRLAEKDAELARLQQELAKVKPTTQTFNEPSLEEFNGDVNQFKQAYKEWVKQEAMREVENVVKANELTKNFVTREAELKKVATDYDEVMQEFKEDYGHIDANLAATINTYLAESELGPEIYYHLAKNRDVTDSLLSKPPYKALAELGKIEAKLSAKKEEPKQVVKKTSTAPAPASKTTGSAPSTKKLTDPDISQAEYREARMKQLKRKM